MTYGRVTERELKFIYRGRQDDISRREIAKRLGRAASSICREFVRNLGLRGYRPKQAQEKAPARAGWACPGACIRFTLMARWLAQLSVRPI